MTEIKGTLEIKVNDKNLKISWVKASVPLQLGAISEVVYMDGGRS